VNMNRALMALTTDIITEYAFARSYNQLDSPGFMDTFEEALMTIYTTGPFALHFPLVFPLLDAIPEWITRKIKPEIFPVIGFRKVRMSANIFKTEVMLNMRNRI